MNTAIPEPDSVRLYEGHPETVTHGIHRQHVTAATLSTVVSAVVHIGLLVFFVSVPMNLGMSPVAPRDVHKVDRLQILVSNIDRQSFVEAVRDLSEPGQGMFSPPAVGEALNTLAPIRAEAATPAPETYSLEDAAPQGAISEPLVALDEGQWQPRQDILAVDRVVALAELPGLERLIIPELTRVPNAADVVLPVDPADMKLEAGRVAVMPPLQALVGTGRNVGTPETPAASDITSDATGDAGVEPPSEAVQISEAATDAPEELFVEAPGDITSVRPIENLLKAGLEVFYDKNDESYGYFRVTINRVDDALLPVVPKDVLLVQDASASIAEQRLYFCRLAMSNIVNRIGPQDRFNVVKFSDTAEFCFPDWAPLSEDSVSRAHTFIEGMRSLGETDILSSLKPLLDVSRQPGRPVVALLITDGLATTGLTRSTDIIGEFSKLNEGRISVFAMGTMMKANTYLLDLLSYCNRGDSRLAVGGRWGIPEALDSLMVEVSQPVMTAVSLRFAEGSFCEVYPWMTMNLFKDRPLHIYGRFPRTTRTFTFQAKGEAVDVDCDMIFTMDVASAKQVKDESIRDHWAQQKIYTLIGEYARTQDPRNLHEMDQTARRYGIEVPYRSKF